MAVTNGINLPPPVELAYSDMILATPVPFMIHNAAADMVIHKRNSGTTMRRRRYNSLGTSKVSLGQDGLPRPAKLLTAVDVDVTIKFYGDVCAVNEQVQLTSQSDALVNATERLAVSLRQSEDELTRDMLGSSAAKVSCIHGDNGDVPSNLTVQDISEVSTYLRGQSGNYFVDGIRGENRFGTGPIRRCYLSMGHTDLENEFNNLPANYLNVFNYPSPDSALPAEVGSILNVRFLLSELGLVEDNASALGADVFSMFTCAQEGYSAVLQEGYRPHMIYRPPIFNDSLAQNATMAWKTVFAPNIDNDSWVINHQCTLS